MSAGVGIFVIFGALFLAVWLSEKIKINLGFLSLAFAVIIGCWFMGLSTNAVFAHFPITITMTFILGPFFFGYIRRVGLFDKIAHNTMAIFGNRPILLPLSVWVAGTVLCACGGMHVTGYVLGSIAYPIAMGIGLDPVIIAMAIWATAASFPWLDTTAVPRGLIELYDPSMVDRGTWQLCIIGIVLHLLYLGIVYFVFRPRNKLANNMAIEKLAFTPKEKKVLSVLIAFISLAAIPSIVNFAVPNPVTTWMSTNLNIYVLFIIGIIVLSFMDIEKADVVIKEDIPWSMVLLLVGTSILIGLLQDVGAVELMSQWLGSSVPSFLIVPFLLLVGGVLTMFANGLVAAQTLNPICMALAPAMNIPFLTLFQAMWKGTSGPNCSPFSTGGAMAVVMCPNEYKEKTIRRMIIISFAILIGQCLLGFTGFFNLFT